MKRVSKLTKLLCLFLLSVAFVWGVQEERWLQARPLTVATQQWLEVRDVRGQVSFQDAGSSRAARPGMRLQAVGDRIETASNSSARLAIDTGAGFVNLSENTTLRIQSFQSFPSGGRLTRLQILAGQARLEVRPFTNPDSGLEVETPAGWSGVRGTEFGIAVRPDGTTGVATLEGGG